MALEAVQIPDDTTFLSFKQQCESTEGWINRYSKGGMEVWMQPTSPDTRAAGVVHKIKCKIAIKDVAAETMYDVLHDNDYRKKWDVGAIDSHDIARLTVNADVGYYSWKCPKPLKNRDVVTLRSWLIMDHEYMIINYSVKHPDYAPRKDLVRAVSLMAGYLVKSTGEKSCTLTYLAQVDPKGSLPKWVVNKSSQYLAPKVLKKISKACHKYPEWKAKNNPQLKPWLNPEQNKLPTIHISMLAIQHADSLEHIDESGLAEVKDDRGADSDEDEVNSKN